MSSEKEQIKNTINELRNNTKRFRDSKLKSISVI